MKLDFYFRFQRDLIISWFEYRCSSGHGTVGYYPLMEMQLNRSKILFVNVSTLSDCQYGGIIIRTSSHSPSILFWWTRPVSRQSPVCHWMGSPYSHLSDERHISYIHLLSLLHTCDLTYSQQNGEFCRDTFWHVRPL